jgi:Flp pilus assembly protein TadD
MRMSKKTKRSKQPPQRLVPPQLLEQQIRHAQYQMLQGNFAEAITTCEPLLGYLPKRSSLRVEVLALLGLAYGMLQHFEKSYDFFTEALSIDPTNAELWYNHGLACRYTTRLGQARRDFERAVELSGNDLGELAPKFAQELERSRKEVQEAMQAHGEDITLDQFIEREELFMQAMSLMRLGKWKEAEQAFRRLIELGGRLPQYWGNLGVSLIMQTCYEEAEAALKRALEIDPGYTLARNNLKKIPDVRRAGGPLGIELRDLSQAQDIKQSVTFYKQSNDSSSPTSHTTIEKIGNTVKGTKTPIGKQPPRYRFFLNPYRDERFTTCPRCNLKTRPRKFTLVIHVDPIYPLTLDKICRYCYHCDLVIAHQDQIEEQLVAHFTTFNPVIIGNDYLVIGTLNWTEWKHEKGQLSTQEMIEHLHDFKEVVTFKPNQV